MLYAKGSALQYWLVQFFHIKYKKQKERRDQSIFHCHVSKQEKKGWYVLAFQDPKSEKKYSRNHFRISGKIIASIFFHWRSTKDLYLTSFSISELLSG